MSLSFEQSLQLNSKKSMTRAVLPTPATMSSDDSFLISEKYKWYSNYHDEEFSNIDIQKNITVNQNQINITQEENSQVIPFQLDRYYDGIDLMDMNFRIYYVNAEGNDGFSTPVNVTYSSNKIRFYWLVDNLVTAIKGNVAFEIQATGTNELGENYCWKTRPNKNGINVLESLQGNGIIEPSNEWYTQFIRDMDQKVSLAQSAVNEAKAAATEANNAISQVQTTVDNAKADLKTYLDQSIVTSLSNYYSKEEVDSLLADIDLTEVYEAINNIDGLANFKTSYNSETRVLTFYNGETVISTETINSNPTAEWVTAYDAKVDSKIAAATSPIQTSLDDYKTITDAHIATIHNDIDGLPETLATDYYNKESTDALLADKADKTSITSLITSISAVESTANTNKSNITVLGNKISNLETLFGDIDTSPQFTYDITYDEEQLLTLWEIENEGADDEVRTVKAQYKILGGGSSGGTSSVLKIEYVTTSPITATVNDKVIIKYNFSGTDSSGDIVPEGTAIWRVNNSVVATNLAVSGENSFDITDYISLGTQKVMLSITDDAGSLVTKSWTVQKIDVRLESSFNDTLTYPLGTVSFGYTPYGATSKTVHFILDGTELSSVTTTSSGIPMSYNLPSQVHGSHLLEAYITADINGSIIESNHVVKDIIWYDAMSNIPVISCIQQNITAKQYDTTNIIYSVYDPKTESPRVTLTVDGETVSTLTLDGNTQTWQYKSSVVGEHNLTITCRDTVKTLKVTVEKLDIDIEPVTAGLAFDFNPVGYSNNDEDRLWSDGEVSMTVSDNFDWVNGGYQIDENGDQYFCIKAGTSATIDYQLFADDAKRNGKEFKLVFKTTNVRKADATFLNCMYGTSSKIGLQMNVHEAYVYASAGNLYLPYSEEDIIEFEININKDTDIPMVMGYEDGVATRPMIYSDSHDFTQINPQVITIGSDDCDVFIYRMKAYSTSLTDIGILNNFIADARSADEMIARYNRNQIYDENNLLTPESLAKACPDLKIIKLECPHFTNDKKDFVKNTNIECVHTGGDPVLDNWTAKNCYHSGQGTTSNEYGAAGRNIDLLMCFDGVYQNSKITFDPDYKTVLTMGDGTVYDDGTGKVTLTRTSVPNNYYNIKVNIASSENANNSCGQNRYNQFLPYKSVAQQKDSRVKNSMEFVNCVLFVKESDPDISTHREFQDCDWHFYAIGNIGDSKKSDNTRVNDPTDPKEFVVEIMDNTLPNSTFSGTDEALAALDADQFDEDGTYGFRYEMSGITDEQRQANMSVWRDFYRFVALSSNEDFVAHLKDWFIVDSALYFYLFTERFTMIDNRAKNTFFHFSKIYISQDEANSLGEEAQYYTIDDDAAQINNGYRFEFWDYDNDKVMSL